MTTLAYAAELVPARSIDQAADSAPQEKFTVSRIRKENFSIFDGEMRQEQIDALDYIQKMAQEGSYYIADWDVLDVFKNPQSGTKKIITDKRSINKRLYEYSKLAKEGIPFEVKAYEQALREFGDNELKALKTRIITNAQNQARAHFDNASAHIRAYDERMKLGAQELAKADALLGKPAFDIFGQCRDVLSAGFWKFHDFNKNHGIIRFTNINPVILSMKNLAAGQDIKVFMGYYLAELNVRDLSIKVKPHKENLFTNWQQRAGNYHTYISNGGDICFGNAAGIAQKHLEKGEFRELMALLALLLTTYSRDTTPYASIERFYESSIAQARSLSGSQSNSTRNGGAADGLAGEHIRGPGEPLLDTDTCVRCDRSSSDCECTTCERCEVTYDPNSEGECGCSYCEICSEHYFGDRDCECCNNCQNEECTCCSICNGTDYTDCACCAQCNSTDENCERCRNCDYHDGHATGCSEAPQQEGSQ